MMISALFISLSLLGPADSAGTAQDQELVPGQVWEYETRRGERKSRLVILKVEQYDAWGEVVHVSVDGVRLRSPSGSILESIGHFPFQGSALRSSLRRLDGRVEKLPDFSEGFAEWKAAVDGGGGGVWSLSVRDALDALQESMAPRTR